MILDDFLDVPLDQRYPTLRNAGVTEFDALILPAESGASRQWAWGG
jgi:hypothetical protein